jgi:hypothetical protein
MPTATQDSPAKEAQIDSVIPPFGIEADHPRNCDLIIQAVPGLILRSAIDTSKGVRDVRTGQMVIPKDQIINMGDFPKTPGMQLHVNPNDCTYVVIDPLAKDERIMELVQQWIRTKTPYRNAKIKLEHTVEGKLDRHRMKTLCREMVWLVQANEAKKVRGSMPDLEDLEALPGYFMLNPGSRVQNTQPIYEKDFEAWVDRLANQGG